MSTSQRVPVAADSVRVWRGFRSPSQSWAQFTRFLDTVMFPIEATWRPSFGLTCYVAGVKGEEADANVPDEFALVFYESQAVYFAGLETPAGAIYPLFPTPAFGAGHSGSPTLLQGAPTVGAPSNVFTSNVDWFHGHVRCLLGAAPDGVSASELAAQVGEILGPVQVRPPAGLDGAIVVIDENVAPQIGSYLLYWEHWSGAPDDTTLDALAALVKVAFRKDAERMTVRGGGLYDRGVHMSPTPTGDQLLRLEFPRRALLVAESAPIWGALPNP